MPKITSTVSDEDIRRSYYETAGYSMWITEMQLDPLQLVVCDDATGKYYRVPVALAKGEFTFGEPVEVAVQYVDSATATARSSIAWASRDDSLAGMPPAPATTASGPGAVEIHLNGPDLIDKDALRKAVEQGKLGRDRETPAQAAARIHAAAQRAAGSAPNTPSATPAAGSTSSEGGSSMTAPDPVKIREALGLTPEATDEQVSAAWAKAYAAPAPAPAPAPTPPADTSPVDLAGLSALAAQAQKLGVSLVDNAQLDEMREMAQRGDLAFKKQRSDERDTVINKAVAMGKIHRSKADNWRAAWDKDPEGTREVIEGLSPDLVPREPEGYTGSVEASAAESALFGLYPEMKPSGGGRRG